MAFSTFGITRPATVDPQDIQIYYTYSENRSDIGTNVWTELDATSVISQNFFPDEVNVQFAGMYDLNLPSNIFNQVGFYCIVVTNRSIRATVTDCGILASNADIKGIIFDIDTVDAYAKRFFDNDGLTGFRIEYLNVDPNVEKRIIPNLARIVTSSNRVEPIISNIQNSSQKSVRYRLNDASTLLFCTVTPSSANPVKPNAFPFIGSPNQEVLLYNTFFDPVVVELEVTENSIETLALGLFGDQTKNCDTGARTIFDSDGNIFKQFNEYVSKDASGNPKYEVRKEKDVIDFSENIDNV